MTDRDPPRHTTTTTAAKTTTTTTTTTTHARAHARGQGARKANETPRELAIRLLVENRTEIASGIYRLSAKLHPAWGAVEPAAFTHNASTLIGAVAEFLGRGDDDVLLKIARDMMKVRKLAGFSAVDFNVMMHVYLPVMRKALLARAPTLRQGAAAFDAVESVVLPLVTRLIEASAKVDSITTPDAQPAFHGRPFEEVSVDEHVAEFMLPQFSDEAQAEELVDDDERTDPGRRR